MILRQGDKGLAHEHVSQADPEKQSILIDTVRPEGGDMKGIGNKCLCQDRYHGLKSIGRGFFDGNSQDC
jgi:hypothetical protein